MVMQGKIRYNSLDLHLISFPCHFHSMSYYVMLCHLLHEEDKKR